MVGPTLVVSLTYILVAGVVKRKLNYMGGGVDKKCLPREGGRGTYFWNSP